jgi:hypothetical protein
MKYILVPLIVALAAWAMQPAAAIDVFAAPARSHVVVAMTGGATVADAPAPGLVRPD